MVFDNNIIAFILFYYLQDLEVLEWRGLFFGAYGSAA